MTPRLLILIVLGISIPNHGDATNLLWESRGQPGFRGTALDVAVQGNVVVSCGSNGTALFESAAWYVRGIDRDTGAMLWEHAPAADAYEQANVAAIADGLAYITGWTVVSGRYQFVVRAYQLRTGQIQWEQAISRGAGRDVAKSLVVADGRVHVVGHLRSLETLSDFAVLTFDATDGTPLWESVINPSGARQNDYAWSVVTDADMVFVAGEVRNDQAVLVRAFDAATGALRWEDEIPSMAIYAQEKALAVHEGTLVLAGEIDFEFAVMAYDTTSGDPLWQHVIGSDGLAVADEVVASSTHAFVTGVTGCDPRTFGDCELAVRAYDLATGALAWERLELAPGGDWWTPSITVHGNAVFVAAESIDATTWEVVAIINRYQASSGMRVWSTDFDGGGEEINTVSALRAVGTSLYVAGQIDRVGGGTDFMVRAYDIR
jgi:outer membrane protein assembly factor BamB